MLSEHFSEDEYFRGQAYDAALLGNARYLARSVLEPLRAALGGRPMIVVSGYRSPERNRAVGGAEKSQHLRALAADVRVEGVAPRTIFDLADRMQRDGAIPPGGLGLYDTFVHLDARGYLARWGADGEERA